MATPTYTLIASYTVGAGGASTIDFTSISSTYTDLLLKFSCRTSGTVDNFENVKVQFNGSGGTAYFDRNLYGTGSGVNTASASNSSQANTYFQYSDAGGSTANTFSSGEMYIPNYASANNKSFSVDSVTENNSSATNSAISSIAAELWASSSAINRITLTPNVAGVFAQNSTAYLYGIKNS
jgi:hypothetical protein